MNFGICAVQKPARRARPAHQLHPRAPRTGLFVVCGSVRLVEIGSAAEWAGTVASTTAVVVALALASRNEEARRSRDRLHALAREQQRKFGLWAEGLADPDADHMTDSRNLDSEAATYWREVDRLGVLRRQRGLRILRRIYGERSVRVAELYPGREEVHASVLKRLATDGARLAIDGDPGPLRRRGAISTGTGDHHKLRAAFNRLARL